MFHVKHHLSLFLVKNDEAKTAVCFISTIMFFSQSFYMKIELVFSYSIRIFAFDSFILNAYALLKIT